MCASACIGAHNEEKHVKSTLNVFFFLIMHVLYHLSYGIEIVSYATDTLLRLKTSINYFTGTSVTGY